MLDCNRQGLPKLTPLLVYGTLKKGEGNAHLIPSSLKREAVETAPGYYLISLGGFPGLQKGGEETVKGELVEVSAPLLATLDRFEGHPNFYRREKLLLSDGREVEAYFYPPGREGLRHHRVVRGGLWSGKEVG